ncbi:unnamed protein product [Phytophthora fragariaefolia]|uniref:Unnamed protein product n=1 Tax=Phytophthora fragariaefolia TaxID=1490495 RepID=A0A9W6TNP5_9STRA|nr:unnamed protein product [Phytophthora fragariaefolia]
MAAHRFEQWVGEAVYKQIQDDCGREVQIPGVVMSYCPMSAKFLLQYSDGSTEGVPVDEIDDYVPLLRQLPSEDHSAKKRKAAPCGGEGMKRHEPPPPTAKRVKASPPEKKTAAEPAPVHVPPTPARSDVSTVAPRFVNDILWALTTTYDVSDAKRQALLATLDKRSEQVRLVLCS